jgi:hypothetical protein
VKVASNGGGGGGSGGVFAIQSRYCSTPVGATKSNEHHESGRPPTTGAAGSDSGKVNPSPRGSSGACRGTATPAARCATRTPPPSPTPGAPAATTTARTLLRSRTPARPGSSRRHRWRLHRQPRGGCARPAVTTHGTQAVIGQLARVGQRFLQRGQSARQGVVGGLQHRSGRAHASRDQARRYTTAQLWSPLLVGLDRLPFRCFPLPGLTLAAFGDEAPGVGAGDATRRCWSWARCARSSMPPFGMAW